MRELGKISSVPRGLRERDIPSRLRAQGSAGYPLSFFRIPFRKSEGVYIGRQIRNRERKKKPLLGGGVRESIPSDGRDHGSTLAISRGEERVTKMVSQRHHCHEVSRT